MNQLSTCIVICILSIGGAIAANMVTNRIIALEKRVQQLEAKITPTR